MKLWNIVTASLMAAVLSCHAAEPAYEKEWSILIPTLEERKECFDFIYQKLCNQIHAAGLDDKVEVLYFCDNREYSIGYKRNDLLAKSKGYYINYVDDDDDVHDNYITMIYERLQKRPDCVSLVGLITIDGKHERTFIHSLKYQTFFEKNGIYYRPPNHLNPIKRSIAIQFTFPEINHGEDSDWALQIVRSNLLKTEEEMTEPYYFYYYVSHKK